MNWVDTVIIVFLVAAGIRGWHAGLIELTLTFTGFISGLLLGSWIVRQAVPHFDSELAKVFTLLLTELLFALLFTEAGSRLARRIKPHAKRWKLGGLNDSFGSVLELIFTLFFIWLMASVLANVGGIGQSVNQSYIIGRASMPPCQRRPTYLPGWKSSSALAASQTYSWVWSPSTPTVSPTNHVDNQAVIADEDSVVKIQGAGCGGIAFGSGFVAAPDLVVTNAHVVAGIAKPQVVDRFGAYFAKVVYFNPNLDIAILRVTNLPDTPLNLATWALPDKDAAATLGYPGGGPLVADNAVIVDHLTAVGRNIYGQGVVTRNIYEIQADVQQGDSGGPLLSPSGKVAGVVFAKSVSQNDIGYAILINQVTQPIKQAESQHQAASTGACTQG